MGLDDIIEKIAEETDTPVSTDPEETSFDTPTDAEKRQKELERIQRTRGWRLAVACHPRDRGFSHGVEHVVLMNDLESGRLSRKEGDSLCSRDFWELRPVERKQLDPDLTCKRCLELFGRHVEDE